MNNKLIDALVEDLQPVKRPSPWAAPRLFLACLLTTLIFAWLMRGNRMLAADPTLTLWSWLKLLPFALGAVACVWLTCDTTIPARRTRRWITTLLIAAVLILISFVTAGLMSPDANVLNPSAFGCVRSIVIFAIPPLAFMLWFARQRATTHPAFAGACAGAAAGLLGSLAYGMSCRIDGLAFISVWYATGILAVATIGSLLGPRILRW
ncbi:MAG: NrsF family protein [Phycisphaeraceae bacterium]